MPRRQTTTTRKTTKRRQTKRAATTRPRRQTGENHPTNRLAARLASATGVGILGELKSDHDKVRDLLKRLNDAEGSSEQASLFKQVDLELMTHAKLEEEVFYPAYKQAVEADTGHRDQDEDRALFFEAAEEHASVETLLAKMRKADPGSDEFEAQACVLKEQVEHHAKEEEKEMFPVAARVMGRERLEDLAVQMKARKTQVQAQLRRDA
jgi:hemerythrin-like domain-containing protein